MKANKLPVFAILIGVICAICLPHLTAQSVAVKPPVNTTAAQWSIQVDKVDAGDINLAPSFQFAIYERLLKEVTKTKHFNQVLRDGASNAAGVPDLLILKTTVQKYSPGSETKRAVTTVTGATKLTVRTQLSTRDGQKVLERTVNGNVRFLGSNLRATHNLARNVAKTIKKGPLPPLPVPAQAGQL